MIFNSHLKLHKLILPFEKVKRKVEIVQNEVHKTPTKTMYMELQEHLTRKVVIHYRERQRPLKKTRIQMK